MNSRKRNWSLPVLVVLFLSACGGGGGASLCTAPCVETGFFGNLDWEDPAGGSGEGVGGGADGGGGIGAGGADGQFRKALVVVKFPDGSLVGSALTDDARGMVTIRPGRTYQGPLLVEIHGQPGATYFEEGKNTYVPYEPGRIQRAVIPFIRRNIGLTPFSEAGYQLSLICQTGSGPPEVCGVGGIGTGGNSTVPSVAAIQAANGHVGEILNQQLPTSLQVDDITRLPFIVNENTAGNEIPMTPRGRYGVANIAFSKQAAMYNSATTTPTLLAIDQLSKDLLDGKLDGLSSAGSVGAAAQRTYDPQTLTSEMSAALAQQTTRYGHPEVIAALPAITAFGNTRYDSYYFDATLEPNGATSTIAVATESPGGTRTPGEKKTYVDSASRGFMLFGNMGSGALFIKTDSVDSSSTILAIGDNSNGELGDGTAQATGRTGPSTIKLPAVMTHAAGGVGHTVARLADGSVYAWGDNTYGQLGQGIGPTTLPRSTQPLRVNLPAGAVAVAASNQASFALLEDSTVYSWGGAWGFGTLGDNTANGERASPGPVVSSTGPLSGVVQLSARDNDAVALKSDGTIWTWGSFSARTPDFVGITGVVPGNVLATHLQGIPVTTGGVRKVLTEQGLFVALVAGNGTNGEDLDGAVYTWGFHFDITAGTVLSDRAPRRVLNLPAVRDLMPGGFLGYGQRPSDRLTAMGIDYDGVLWKIRGRVAEQYDPANPMAQRRPKGQVNRPDCDSCHVVRPKTLPTVPSVGPTCTIPGHILALLTTQSRCENCHNSAPRAQRPLECVPPPLPRAGLPTNADPKGNRCTLTQNHPVFQSNAPCASCHNSVVRAPLACSPDEKPIDPASGTVPLITAALDDVEPFQGQLSDGGFTNDTTPTLIGTLVRNGAAAPLAAGEIVRVYGDNGILVGASAASTGATSWQFPVPALAAGVSYSFTARVEGNDAAQGSASNLFRLVVSTGGPDKVVRLESINGSQSPTSFTNNPAVTLVGTLSPALAEGETVQLTRTGLQAPLTMPGCGAGCTRWTFSDSLSADATYDYQARVIGLNGVAGPAGNTLNVVLDTTRPTATPAISVNARTPGGNIEAVRGSRVSGTGIHDPSPVLSVRVDSGAATNDQVEVSVSLNGGAFSVLNTTPVVSGAASFEVTHNSTAAINLRVGSDVQPASTTPIAVVYRAQMVDRAGNRGPLSDSTHEIGFFGCFDLKREGGALDANSGSPPLRPHSGIAEDQPTCRSCHSTGTGNLLQVPRPTLNAAYRYWCTFSDSDKVALRLLQFAEDPRVSPFLKK